MPKEPPEIDILIGTDCISEEGGIKREVAGDSNTIMGNTVSWINAKMAESETVEYKKSLGELKEGLISIVAILNKHKHGELRFGVRNDGRAAGINATEKTLRGFWRNPHEPAAHKG